MVTYNVLSSIRVGDMFGNVRYVISLLDGININVPHP